MPRLRLLCFPYAGGTAAVFRGWQARLPGGITVLPVQLPGRATRIRETPFDDVRDLVSAAATALESDLAGRFALFGHSMGALVAFELARELRRRGRALPVLLLTAGHEAPHRPPPLPPFSHLADAEFVEEVRRRYAGIPDEVLAEPELLELLLPVLRADIRALEAWVYSPEPPLECAVSAFGGADDPHLGADDVEAWREQTSGSFRARILPGDHFFLENGREPLLQAIAEDLRPWLDGGGGR